MTDIKDRIRKFIVENFLFGDDTDLGEETSFLENGIIDSTGILELVNFLEEEFQVTILDEELVPENLDSISLVVRYLREKQRETPVMPLPATM
jgi:acyl carrier protein